MRILVFAKDVVHDTNCKIDAQRSRTQHRLSLVVGAGRRLAEVLPRSRKSFEKSAKPHAKELRVPYEMMGADVLDATLMRLHSVDCRAYGVGELFSAQTQLAPQETQPPAYVHINTTRLRKPPAPVPAATYAAAQRTAWAT